MLNDHPPDNQFIVTVPGRGYQFVQRPDPAVPAEADPGPGPAGRHPLGPTRNVSSVRVLAEPQGGPQPAARDNREQHHRHDHGLARVAVP